MAGGSCIILTPLDSTFRQWHGVAYSSRRTQLKYDGDDRLPAPTVCCSAKMLVSDRHIRHFYWPSFTHVLHFSMLLFTSATLHNTIAHPPCDEKSTVQIAVLLCDINQAAGCICPCLLRSVLLIPSMTGRGGCRPPL